jgi:addiction module HigA family antidote
MPLEGAPPLPGSVLKEQILKPLGIKQADLARAMGVSKPRIHYVVNGRSPITVELALRLGRVTNTTPEYWLALQSEFDLHRARNRLAVTLASLRPLVGQGPDHRTPGEDPINGRD